MLLDWQDTAQDQLESGCLVNGSDLLSTFVWEETLWG